MSENKLAAFLADNHALPDMQPLAQITQRDHYSIQLPRRIYLFWDTGFDTAPDIIKFCAQSWQSLNPDWDVILLDQTAANAILPRAAFPNVMKIAHYADMLRTALVANGGGVWADASALCLKPLDHWLPHIFNQCEFFAFHKPAPDRLISNWFLAANDQSAIAAEMFALFQAYWDWGPFQHGKPPYFWFHQLFEHLVHNRRDIKQRWTHTPKISAVPVHQLKRVISGKVSNDDRTRDRIKSTPVQKLTHKQDIQPQDVSEILGQIDIKL